MMDWTFAIDDAVSSRVSWRAVIQQNNVIVIIDQPGTDGTAAKMTTFRARTDGAMPIGPIVSNFPF